MFAVVGSQTVVLDCTSVSPPSLLLSLRATAASQSLYLQSTLQICIVWKFQDKIDSSKSNRTCNNIKRIIYNFQYTWKPPLQSRFGKLLTDKQPRKQEQLYFFFVLLFHTSPLFGVKYNQFRLWQNFRSIFFYKSACIFSQFTFLDFLDTVLNVLN